MDLTLRRSVWLFYVSAFLLTSRVSHGQVREPQFADWPEQCAIPGRVIVSNDLTDRSSVSRLIPRLVAGKSVLVISTDKPETQSTWRGLLTKSVGEQGQIQVVQVSENATPKSPFREAALSDQADCVLIESEAVVPKEFLASLVTQGKTIIFEGSPGTTLGDDFPDNSQSRFEFFPDAVIELANEGKEEQAKERVRERAEQIGSKVGVVIAPNTAVLLSGRKVTTYGAGQATLIVPKSDTTVAHRQQISAFRSRRQSPSSYLADWTQWRRLAMERTLPKFPPTEPPIPHVENGALLIVGGGGSPKGLMERFVELAGGPQNARLVYVPCSEETEVSASQGMVRVWKRMGVKHATFIHTKDRNKANTDEAFMAPLKDATGIFFGGGRQWNFADSYYGTKTHQLMKDVLKRGGVIAGSSAGASIQARYLARATPIGNTEIMAPGYERGGLGFLGGVAIDQHFTQRGRQKDMKQLMATHPQLLGIGIDEATAIEVSDSLARVTGRGDVYFYDAESVPQSEQQTSDAPLFVKLPAGSVYDLAARKVIVDRTEAPE